MGTLNVGGTHFQARRSTLTRTSRYFHNIYCGPFACKDPADGELFIDAEPEIFRHVLQFLRRGCLDSKAPVADLEQEARVFGMDELEEAAKRQRLRGQLLGCWLYARSAEDQYSFFISMDGDSLLSQEV